MRQKRYLLRWLIILLITVGVGWRFAKSPSTTFPSSSVLPTFSKMVQWEVPYQVRVKNENVLLDLPFDAETEYDLIVSSLGDAEQSFEVSLTSQNIEQASSLPIKQLEDLQRPLHRSNAPVPKSNLHQITTSVQPVSKERIFQLHVTEGSLDDPAQYIDVSSRLVGEGKQVRVYLDQQSKPKELATGLVDEIVRLFDHKIVVGFQKQIGKVRDVDGDGKFTILLTPWLGKLQGGKTSLDGFVRGCDFDPNVKLPFGQRCDMMYLNTQLEPGKHLQSLLAHEFTHALLFSYRLKQVGTKTELQYEEDWLNEAIAHLGENLCGNGWSNLDYRISRFLESPQNYPLVVNDYYRSGMWRNHGCRGATYLFLRWVIDQYGIEVLPQLIQSPVNGKQNIERVTKLSFAELFRRWNVSMFMSRQEKTKNTSQKERFNLWGKLGEWNLAGVATIPWNSDREKTKKISVKGTASAFVHLKGTGNTPYQRITIQAKPGTQLQVTFIRHRAKQNSSSSTSKIMHVARTTAGDVLEVDIQYNSKGYRIETISIEANEGSVKESICFQKEDMQRMKSKLRFSQSSRCYFPSLPERLQKTGTKLLVKAVLVDQSGNRTAARQILPCQTVQ